MLPNPDFSYKRRVCEKRIDRCATAAREERMNPNKALWEKGDFTRIAASMRESGEELVQMLGVTKGMKVLDLVAAMARRRCRTRLGADVLGVDIAANLVEAGNRRAKAKASRIAGFRKATPPICTDWKTIV